MMRGMGLLPRRSRLDVAALFRALGTGPRAVIDAYAAGDAAALVALLDALTGPWPGPVASDAHWGDVEADLAGCLAQLARAHPEAFIAAVERRPALLARSEVLTAAAAVPGDRAADWLLEALGDSHGIRRWQALRSLLARGEPRVIPRLRTLLRDRDSSVRFAAADGLRRFGVAADLDELWRYHRRAPRGGAERALDAIESICARADLPLPPPHPGARLVTIELPADTALAPCVDGFAVRAGALLATSDTTELRAPCDGQVIAIDHEPTTPSRRLVLRRETVTRPGRGRGGR
jgi:hypothetical protein